MSSKQSRLDTVSLTVGRDFLLPPTRVDVGVHKVFRAAVPEAPIDEYAHLLATENHVGFAAEPGDRRFLFPKPQPSHVQATANLHFDGGFAVRIRLHYPANQRGTGLRRARPY
jgi:hypothetical protein